MIYSPHAPYEILQNSCLDFVKIQRLRRFSRYWDLVANSGNFPGATPRLMTAYSTRTNLSKNGLAYGPLWLRT